MLENIRPCPCGSGKNYENCCGIWEAIYFQEQARWRSAGQELRRTLGRFAHRLHFSRDAARAQDLYLGYIDKRLIDSDDDFIMERCLEWFIFDYRLNSGRTIIETYRDEYHQVLSGPEATLLQSWTDSYNSLYEVIEVLPEEGLIIKDIFDPVGIKISDVNASLNIEQGSILLMRVLQVGKEYEFSTSGLALPRRLRDPLRQKLQGDRLQFYREQRTRVKGWDDYLKERAHVINGWVMDRGMSNHVSGIDMPEKDMLKRIAILTIVNWEQVLGFIKNSAQFKLIGETYDAAGVFREAAAAILGESCC
ncbi:MAG: SEC-C domain-containing protein, partial [Desulfotomaculaceae bacterium]|nr:SEC-C domain-containing protein [Desulfotomaculaceae bacterium]